MANKNDNVVDAGELPEAEVVDVVDAGELPEAEVVDVEESPQAQASLGVNDLHLMAMIIDIVSQRGAIRANEMENVGVLYNKLVNFLVANGIIKDPAAPIPAPDNVVPENTDTQVKEEQKNA
jgi:hypothetical protein